LISGTLATLGPKTRIWLLCDFRVNKPHPNTSRTLHCSCLHHHLMIFAAGTSSTRHSALLQLIPLNCTPNPPPLNPLSLYDQVAFLTDFQSLHWWQPLENESSTNDCSSCRASLPTYFLLRKVESTTISCQYRLLLCILAQAKMNPSTTSSRIPQIETASSLQSQLRRAARARIETPLVLMICQSLLRAP
jgi:hypothetical protein